MASPRPPQNDTEPHEEGEGGVGWALCAGAPVLPSCFHPPDIWLRPHGPACGQPIRAGGTALVRRGTHQRPLSVRGSGLKPAQQLREKWGEESFLWLPFTCAQHRNKTCHSTQEPGDVARLRVSEEKGDHKTNPCWNRGREQHIPYLHFKKKEPFWI